MLKCKCIKDCPEPIDLDIIAYFAGDTYEYESKVYVKHIYWHIFTHDNMDWYYDLNEVSKYFINISEHRDNQIERILNES